MNIIGISGNILEENSIAKVFVNRTYIDSVVRANGIPFIMPICEDENIIKKMINGDKMNNAEIIITLTLIKGLGRKTINKIIRQSSQLII